MAAIVAGTLEIVMTPIDPTRPAKPSPRSPAAPRYVDEDPNIDSVEQGLEAAENELRDEVADRYEEAAVDSPEEKAKLDDIDHGEAGEPDGPAELRAMRRSDSE